MSSKEQGVIYKGAERVKSLAFGLAVVALFAALIPEITVPALMVAETSGIVGLSAKVVESATARK